MKRGRHFGSILVVVCKNTLMTNPSLALTQIHRTSAIGFSDLSPSVRARLLSAGCGVKPLCASGHYVDGAGSILILSQRSGPDTLSGSLFTATNEVFTRSHMVSPHSYCSIQGKFNFLTGPVLESCIDRVGDAEEYAPHSIVSIT